MFEGGAICNQRIVPTRAKSGINLAGEHENKHVGSEKIRKKTGNAKQCTMVAYTSEDSDSCFSTMQMEPV